MAAPPLINGQMVSWAEIKFSLDVHDGASFKTEDIAAIKFSDDLDIGQPRGFGGAIRGMTAGIVTVDGSITFYFDAFIQFQRKLKEKAPLSSDGLPSVGLVKFDVPIAWEPLDGNGEVFTAKMEACRIAGRSLDFAPGPDAGTVEVPLKYARLLLDGAPLL